MLCQIVICILFDWNVPPVHIRMPKRQTAANMFCLLLCVPRASGALVPLICWRFCPQFIWLSAFVGDPHYNPEIRYTSKLLKLNKIKSAAHHRRYTLIEHIYICLLISCSTTNFPLFIYLNVLSFSYRAALKKCPHSFFANS